MHTFRQIPIGENAENAVTVGIERNISGSTVAAVWWPAHGDVDGDGNDRQRLAPDHHHRQRGGGARFGGEGSTTAGTTAGPQCVPPCPSFRLKADMRSVAKQLR